MSKSVERGSPRSPSTLRYEELARAYQRMRGRPDYPPQDELMRRVLAFIKLDLKTLSAGDWLNWQHELVALALLGDPVTEDPNEIIPKLIPNIPPLPTLNEGEEIKQLSQNHIDEIISTNSTTFKPKQVDLTVTILRGPIIKKLLTHAGRQCEHGKGYLAYEIRRPEDAFQFVLANLLKLTGARLRQCIECKTTFLGDRLDQLYCGKLCQSRATTRRWREKNTKSKGKLGRRFQKDRSKIIKGGSRDGKKKR